MTQNSRRARCPGGFLSARESWQSAESPGDKSGYLLPWMPGDDGAGGAPGVRSSWATLHKSSTHLRGGRGGSPIYTSTDLACWELGRQSLELCPPHSMCAVCWLPVVPGLLEFLARDLCACPVPRAFPSKSLQWIFPHSVFNRLKPWSF